MNLNKICKAFYNLNRIKAKLLRVAVAWEESITREDWAKKLNVTKRTLEDYMREMRRDLEIKRMQGETNQAYTKRTIQLYLTKTEKTGKRRT